MIKTNTLVLVGVIVAVQLYSCSFADANSINKNGTTSASEKILPQNEEPDSMVFPLEVIRRHTQNEITVEFDKKVTIVNEFEYSFEIEFLNAVIVKVGTVSNSQYRN
ncbi:MAG: hypothetical protein P8L80_05855, partial [Flavobacteriales bacterium]|nr:hypothetical protein [Flavobacteriales bacterium]